MIAAPTVRLAAGEKLGPYEIVAPIGAGGMGEVYRARDTRLGRAVAVKVLPVVDEARAARFREEARAAGQIDHPAILAIHDVGAHDGAPYLVAELLEGETLRRRLAAGPLPARRAVELARELAQGLAAAHDKGVVHRDLKPENLFLTRDGRLKILDFGLAKLADGGAAADGVPLAPTQPGVLLGTVGYMAPEQVRGQPADHRSDLFSFGAVLYEMVTGRRAFLADSQVETMSAILKEEPPPMEGAPPALERLVRHCLEKRAADRFQSARDLAFGLSALAAEPSLPSLATGPRAPAARLRARRRFAPLAVAAALLALPVAAFLVGARVGRVEPPTWRQLTFRRGLVRTARLAPDGETVVYGAAWDGAPMELFSARPGTPESRTLGLRGDVLAVSSTGEMALLVDRRDNGLLTSAVGVLARAPLAGGAPRPLADAAHEADWSPDGAELAVVREEAGRYRLEYPLGRVRYQSAGWLARPRFAPTGDALVVIDHPVLGDDRGRLVVIDLAGDRASPMAHEWASLDGVAWAPGGALWFTATDAGVSRALWAAGRDGGGLRLLARAPAALTLQDVARDGRALVTRESLRGALLTRAPGADEERDLAWLDSSAGCDLSADGKRLLLVEGGDGGGPDYGIYLRGTDGAPAVRLGDGRAAALSPDGRWVIAIRRGDPDQLVLVPTGAGAPRPLTHDAIAHHWAAFFPDGKRVAFSGSEPGHGARLWVMEIDPSGPPGPPRAVSAEGVSPRHFSVAPDGSALLGVGAGGVATLFPLDGGAARPVPGAGPRDFPITFASDGKSIFIGARGMPARIDRLDLATGARTPFRTLRPADPAGVPEIASALITPDGSAYVYPAARMLSDLFLVEGLR